MFRQGSWWESWIRRLANVLIIVGNGILFGFAHMIVGSTGRNCGSVILFTHVTLLGMPVVAKKDADGEFAKYPTWGVHCTALYVCLAVSP